MPRQPKRPRLYLRKARVDNSGRHSGVWLILDGGRQISTGCDADDVNGAERALAGYLNEKHVQAARSGPRSTDQIPVVDVLTLYARDVAPSQREPRRAGHALRRLGEFFGTKTLAGINGPVCRDYARAQSTDTVARRDLEIFRAAINHHRKEGLHDRIVSVVMPDKRPARERWLTRSEAARLIWAAYRYRVPDDKPVGLNIRGDISPGSCWPRSTPAVGLRSSRKPRCNGKLGVHTLILSAVSCTAARKATRKQRSGDRRFRSRPNSLRTRGAGSARARVTSSNGTGVRFGGSTRYSRRPLKMPDSKAL
jgi:hypothetical protein